VVSTDPDGDNVSYMFDILEYRKWSEFVPSGNSYEITYKWEKPGEHNFKVRTQDIYGGMSNWEIHEITIEKSKDKSTDNMLLLRILESFPLLERLYSLFGT
jgi:hypothetical protein